MSEAAGEYNRRIHIEQQTGKGGLNQPSGVWDVWRSPWARVRGQGGSRIAQGMSNTGVTDAPKIYAIRVRPMMIEISENMRVNLDGIIFDIKTVTHDFANREFTDMVCVTGENNG